MGVRITISVHGTGSAIGTYLLAQFTIRLFASDPLLKLALSLVGRCTRVVSNRVTLTTDHGSTPCSEAAAKQIRSRVRRQDVGTHKFGFSELTIRFDAPHLNPVTDAIRATHEDNCLAEAVQG